ncbi:MAG: diguanylate cyclase [Thermodesulfobacteriota bacterium]|nr:diguanylate cyclase [Thermodesulfobacteriota bacterium]
MDDRDKEKETFSHRILIVDDEEVIRATLCQIMNHAGYQCSNAASAKEALQFLDHEKVDVVITDIRMPGMNGFALTETIKQKHHADVIIITGYGGQFSYEEAMEKGASDFALKPVRPKELIARLRRVLRERALLAERRRMEEQLRELTVTDDLTRLHNSRHFFKMLQDEIDRARRYHSPLSLLLMDVDGFKRFNDAYGHLEGDKVLSKLGEVIRDCLRTNDSGYRYGGDEFTVILPVTRGQEAKKVAERIREQFEAVAFTPAEGIHVDATISVGIAEYQPDEGLTEFAKRADEAMYNAKRQGGGQTVLA